MRRRDTCSFARAKITRSCEFFEVSNESMKMPTQVLRKKSKMFKILSVSKFK